MEYIFALKPIILAVAALIGLYVLFHAFKALFYLLAYAVLVVIAAMPFFLLVIGILFGLNYESTGLQDTTIGGLNLQNMPDKFSFIFVLVGIIASVGFFLICVRSKLFKTINQKFNPLPPPTESVKLDLSHLPPKKK